MRRERRDPEEAEGTKRSSRRVVSCGRSRPPAPERMRSLLVVLCCLAVALWTPVSVDAATCPSICETTDLWGTGGQAINWRECQCTYSTTGAARTGPNCGCGACYIKRNGHVFGQDRTSNGACPDGYTACDDCEVATSSGSSNSTTSPTTSPTSTTSPATDSSSSTLTPSSTSSSSGASGDSTPATGNKDSLNATSSPTTATPGSNVTASVNSSHGSHDGATNSPGGTLGSPSSNNSSSSDADTNDSSDSKGPLETWQIALIICSAVLVISVVMITITSCYCKARNRMKDNELIEEDTREYENYWHPGGDDDRGGEKHLASSGFGASLTQGGRNSFNSTHSRPNSAKNTAYEPTYGVDDRIGAGRSHRGSLGSNADLPGIFQPFQGRDRPRHEVGSLKNVAIEL